ncbi:MAG: sulfite exporter TauE/SafE family protein [Leptospiraceae bacterium]|nr:sulfite exporter TauE/SafE family protein [Leptospiraceae bacterium]MCP5510304.1 sulfite exporter TauE/SafE family protein [Leptospiraceae bacterium]
MDNFLVLLGTIFLHGITSSFHCIGMCGPLAGSLRSSGGSSLNNNLIYNSGRLFSYALLGALLGFTGKGADQLGNFIEIKWFSGILAGSLLILSGIRLIFSQRQSSSRLAEWTRKFSFPIYSYARSGNLSEKEEAFLIGLVSALLPCGVLFPAYVISFSAGTVSGGAILMAVFFLGTFPGLFLFGWGLQYFKKYLKPNWISKIGILTILLGLGIVLWRIQFSSDPETCHSPSNFLSPKTETIK